MPKSNWEKELQQRINRKETLNMIARQKKGIICIKLNITNRTDNNSLCEKLFFFFSTKSGPPIPLCVYFKAPQDRTCLLYSKCDCRVKINICSFNLKKGEK